MRGRFPTGVRVWTRGPVVLEGEIGVPAPSQTWPDGADGAGIYVLRRLWSQASDRMNLLVFSNPAYGLRDAEQQMPGKGVQGHGCQDVFQPWDVDVYSLCFPSSEKSSCFLPHSI